MNNFNEILKKTVFNNRRVIIPDLGAFIHDSTENTIVFSTLLKNNDTFLEQELYKNGINNPSAELATFINKVNTTTKRGKRFNIYDFGYFFSEGETLQFMPVKGMSQKIKTRKKISKKWKIAIFLITLIITTVTGLQIYRSIVSHNSVNAIMHNHQIEKRFAVAGKTAENHSSDCIYSGYGRNFHIVVGFFEKKANAEQFVFQCKNRGYAEAKIISRIGELFPVSIGSYASTGEAVKYKNEYNSKYREQAWIYATK
ncbi:MAG: SPOR domain-containing protein [Prevotellaceae bacterium]|jgi:hypothetical protein|nr:SPOR domain-containing protein [Prevotellaceae bacterium]